METKTEVDQSPLKLFSLEEAEKNLPVVAELAVDEEKISQLESQASELIDELFELSVDDIKAKQEYARGVQDLGRAVQQKLVHKSNLLKEPMGTLLSDLQDGGSVADALLNLQATINQINPNRFNFNMNGFRRFLSKIPGVGTALANWLVQFQAVESVINDIIESLKVGRQRLDRDNITLNSDQVEMNSLAKQLRNYIEYGKVVDIQLSGRLETEMPDGDKKTFLQKDVLFPLRQRIVDLQQQLAVNQYGMVTAEAIIQNNKELIRGVDRSLNVTVVAFQTASTLSIALEHQKKVLKGVQAVNETTNDLLLQTSEKLRDQGAVIQQEASSASIDTNVLKQAFHNVDMALKEVNEFRVKALPKLSSSIEEMTNINTEMEKSIDELQASKQMSDKLTLDF